MTLAATKELGFHLDCLPPFFAINGQFIVSLNPSFANEFAEAIARQRSDDDRRVHLLSEEVRIAAPWPRGQRRRSGSLARKRPNEVRQLHRLTAPCSRASDRSSRERLGVLKLESAGRALNGRHGARILIQRLQPINPIAPGRGG